MQFMELKVGNVIDKLKEIPNESVDCIVTSPPYYGLRSYKGAEALWGGTPNCQHEWVSQEVSLLHENRNNITGTQEEAHAKTGVAFIKKYDKSIAGSCSKCGAWHGQLGLEPDYHMYINHLMLVTRELKRVLKPTGTLFWNMADSYSGNMGKRNGWTDNKMGFTKEEGINAGVALTNFHADYGNISQKSLMMMPERFALAMLDEGWILRNKICWAKRNGMPSSVKDRLANKWEYVFFFTKSKRYFFDLDSIRKPLAPASIQRANYGWHGKEIQGIGRNQPQATEKMGERWSPSKGANPGDIIETDYKTKEQKYENEGAYPQAHSGYFNEDGSLRVNLKGANPGDVLDIATKPHKFAHFAVFPETLVEPFIKAGCPQEGVVLDPFTGSGTTMLVAKQLSKSAIGIEISEEYAELIKKRLIWGFDPNIEWKVD
jgi:site-specific DNA-methyltransferase (cytosine-N4-specific)